jgi:tetratricopeptide (TPR) repeat protein
MTIIRPFLLAVFVSASAIVIGCANRQSATPEFHAIDLYVQAVDAYHNGDRTGAIAKLTSATRQNPNLRMAQSMLGDLYRQQGQYSLALPHYQALADLDPYGPTTLYRLGITNQFLNRLQDAIAAYLKALDLNPRDAKSSSSLGLVYMALGRMDDALSYCRKATEFDPRSASAWSNYGVVLDSMGNPADAERAYRKSLELNRAQDAIVVNLGANLTRQKKSAEAINVLAEAVRKFDNAVTHKLYGDALASGNRFDEALAQYDIALKKDPRYYPALNQKADVLVAEYRKGLELDEKKKADAIALWKQSLSINAQQPRIQAMLQEWTQPRLFAK